MGAEGGASPLLSVGSRELGRGRQAAQAEVEGRDSSNLSFRGRWGGVQHGCVGGGHWVGRKGEASPLCLWEKAPMARGHLALVVWSSWCGTCPVGGGAAVGLRKARAKSRESCSLWISESWLLLNFLLVVGGS